MGEVEGGDHRSGATSDNIFPCDRKGCLDDIIFYNTGMTRARRQTRYYLFFHLILFYVCGVGRSGIRSDPRNS